ncbi:hypothetical protein PG5_09440 [Pseudomonas sp. G5(2012)]|nr:hypothetical protein PG5_09440 [Pseudomonas sp. G5(2012)]
MKVQSENCDTLSRHGPVGAHAWRLIISRRHPFSRKKLHSATLITP